MTPDERKQPAGEELVSLNADDLDEQALEDVSGGQACTLTINCSPNYMNPDDANKGGTAM